MPDLMRKFSRRKFMLSLAIAVPCIVAGQMQIEPVWLKTRRINLTQKRGACRVLHFSDLHYRGGRKRLESLVAAINNTSPDLVCFTGDLIEDRAREAECLQLLSKIKAPLFGVPGNHDYWSRRGFGAIADCFNATGGAWLIDEQRTVPGGKAVVTGCSCLNATTPIPEPVDGMKNVVLMHYPAWVRHVKARFDLLLAGHSHGGQVRLPFYGAVMLPFAVGEYDMGLFKTAAGPLYVNPGIGWFGTRLRWNCRPELTVIEI